MCSFARGWACSLCGVAAARTPRISSRFASPSLLLLPTAAQRSPCSRRMFGLHACAEIIEKSRTAREQHTLVAVAVA